MTGVMKVIAYTMVGSVALFTAYEVIVTLLK